MNTIIGQGAEAIVYKEEGQVVKERFAKSYRHPKLDDSLRKFRTRREGKVLEKLEEIEFLSPRLQDVDDKEMRITMDFVSGQPLREVFSLNHCKIIGEKIAKLHSHDIIHGDLTTSNMIESNGDIAFVDFGLSFFSKKNEDKAVDLHLLDRALESKHHETYPENINIVLESYKESCQDAGPILQRYEAVIKRGRNKVKG